MGGDGESSAAIVAGDNGTVASRSTAATTSTNLGEEGLASLGLSKLEIEEQQAALRKIQAQNRREEQRRITAALRNQRRKPPATPPPPPPPRAPQYCQQEKTQKDFNAKAQRPCDGNSLPLTDDSFIQEQLRILRDIEEKNRVVNGNALSESSSSIFDCKPRSQHSTAFDEGQEPIPSDQAIAREQQLLCDELQVSGTKSQERDSYASFASRPASRFISAPVVPASRVPPQLPKKPTRWSSSPIETSNGKNNYHDSTLQLGNGTKVRVKGTSHVYNSILAGKKTVFTECVTCGTISQVNGSGSSRLFYCTICQQVGPVQEMTTCQQDADLASALQNQEREAAYQRKI